MRHRSLVGLLAVSLALAGCTAGPLAPLDDNQPGENTTNGTPPGVTNGQLTNASALVHAHETSLDDTGFVASVTQSANRGGTVSYDVVASAGRSRYTLSGNQSADDNTTREMRIWANESHRVGVSQSGGESRYHAARRGTDSFDPLEAVGVYLAAGTFTVANETTEEGYTVLTADDVGPPAADDGRFRDAESFSGRAVVDETGRVHELAVTVERPRGEETYTFVLQRTGVASVERPAWVDDVPAGVFLAPQLTIDVRDGTVLAVQNEGDDAVPTNATLTLTTDNTTYRATFDAPLEPGEVQYAAITTDDDTLRLTSDRPASSDVTTLTSPVSVTIETASGVTLHSGGMGWDSASGSSDEGTSDGSGESSAEGEAAAG